MDILTKGQRAILQCVSTVPGQEQFYLTGGTALAYFYLQHRQSHDLDLFTTTEELIIPWSHQLEAALHARGMTTERRRGVASFVELVVQEGPAMTLVQLALDAACRFEPTKTFPEFPRLQVDSLADLAANKLLALFGRAMLRDFLDVYALVHHGGFSPEALMAQAQRKDPGFDVYWLGVALERITAFNDTAPEWRMLVKPVMCQEVQAFYRRWRADIMRQLGGQTPPL